MKLSDLKKRAAELAQTGANKSRQLAAIAKLKAVNLSEEDAIRKAYLELGKQYFAMYGEHPEDEFVAACNIIKEAQAAIAANNDMIAEMKAASAANDVVDAVLEETPAAEAVKEAVEAVEEAVEEAAEVAEEAAEEVVAAVEEAVEEVAETVEEAPVEE